MKIIVTGKNISVTDKIQAAIDKKFEKLGKYFADDIKATVVMHPEKAKVNFRCPRRIHRSGRNPRANISHGVGSSLHRY